MKNNLSPIVLFVYNRPNHTQKTLSALSKNTLADQSSLYIYCDGVKRDATEKDIENITQVREIVRSKQWCAEVKIIERDRNWGLAESIIDGVTSILNKFDRVIVLEDDIVTSHSFLKYMNDALNLYQGEKKVMHISGYFFPVKGWEKLPETFFYNTTSCWGWATWKRAWNMLETNPSLLKEKIILHPGGLKKFNLENRADFLAQLNENISNNIKTWAVKWYASMFINNGYALHPRQSFTNNIGHDGSGDNCGKTNKFYWPELSSSIEVKKIPLSESIEGRNKMKKFYSHKSKKNKKQILKDLLPRVLIRTLKKLLNSLNKHI